MLDFELNSNFGTYWDKTGDVSTVEDVDRIEQGIVIRVVEEVDLSAPPPTPSAIEAQRSAIEEAVYNTDVSQPPIDVFVVDSPLMDTNENNDVTVLYEVQTSRVTTQLPIE